MRKVCIEWLGVAAGAILSDGEFALSDCMAVFLLTAVGTEVLAY